MQTGTAGRPPNVVTGVKERHRLAWWREPETLVCGVRGHVVPVARSLRVAPEWAHLEAVTTDGRRLGRCLRCDVWVEAPSQLATEPELGDLRQEDVPRRGRQLREAAILRLIAVERGFHSVGFGLAAVGLLVLRLDLPVLQDQARQLTRGGTGGIAGPGQTASRDVIVRQLQRILQLHRGTLGVLVASAAVYCVLEGIEAVGLWRERRWAEYLTAVATAGFLPFELKELATRVTAFKVGALILNLVVLAYLVWRKQLFGVGRREQPEDRLAPIRSAPGGRP